jgi:hypothetical protein
MSQLDRQGLISQSNFLFPDNTSQEITPADIRQFNSDIADSLALTGSAVLSASYADNALSASHAIISDNAYEIFVLAKNTSGHDIPKGYAVHSSGVTGDKININTASYDEPTLMPAIGITQEAISNNAVGEVILTGRIRGVNTSNLTPGATVYVNGDGSLTSTKPTGSALIQNIGTCVKSNATEGEILVLGSGRSNDVPNIQEGYAWVGDIDGVAQPIPTSSFSGAVPVGVATTGSNTFNGDQIISGSVTIDDPSSTAFTVTSGPGDSSPVIIEGGFNGVDKFTNSSIRGISTYGGDKISGSWGEAGNGISFTGQSGQVGIYNANTGSGAASYIVLGHSSGSSFVSVNGGFTGIVGNPIQLQALGGGATSVQVTGDVTASGNISASGDVTGSTFTGSFVGDGSGLTLGSDVAYTNVANTFTEPQTINDQTSNTDFKAFTIQKQGQDILTLYNSSSAEQGEGRLELTGSMYLKSDRTQAKIYVRDNEDNLATIGTDSIGIQSNVDSFPLTKFTSAGLWGRSEDSDNNDTSLWISGTPSRIISYGYSLDSSYYDTVGVYVATGPQYTTPRTPLVPLFYQYISSSAEYQGGDASVHFGSNIVADKGFRTSVNILGGTTPLDIFASGSRKLKVNSQGLVNLGDPDIETYGTLRHEGILDIGPKIGLGGGLVVTGSASATQLVADEELVTPSIASPTGTLTIFNNTVVSGSIQVQSGNPVVATQFQAEELVAPNIASPTGTVTIGNNTIISGSLILEQGNPIEATQVQAYEELVAPSIASPTGTITLGMNTVVSGSLILQQGNPIEATQVQAYDELVTPSIISTTGKVTIFNNVDISGSVNLEANNSISATQVVAEEELVAPIITSQTGTLTISNNTILSGSLILQQGNPIEATQLQAVEELVTPAIASSTGTLTISNNTILSGSLILEQGNPIEATQLQAVEELVTPSINSPTGTVEFNSVVQLPAQDPLPTGATGQLAVSASNLYYHNGTSWSQIN